MNGHASSRAAAGVGGDGKEVNNEMMTTTTTTTTTTAVSSDESEEEEGIEISSLVSTTAEEEDNYNNYNNNNSEGDKLQTTTATTEYDTALHAAASSGSSSRSMEEEEAEEDEEDTMMYQCQMWTASFPDGNSTTNDNNDLTATDNDKMSKLRTLYAKSAFAALSGGDIWSTEAFSLPSPLHDILSSNAPLSLQELLAQDELLQELRGCDVKLVEYFGGGGVVAELVQCVFCEVPYVNEGFGGRERWCLGEGRRREIRRELREGKDKKREELELERLGSHDEEFEEDSNNDDDDEALQRNPKLLFSSPRENGEEPNVETQWISPAVSPDKPSRKMGGGWIFNHHNNEGEDDEGEEGEQRTPEEEYDLRFVRYPYMACEVLCSEVGSTLDVLVDGYIDMQKNEDRNNNTNQEEGAVKGIATPFVVEEYEDVDILNTSDNSSPDLQMENPLQPRSGNDRFQPHEQKKQQQQQQTSNTTSNKRILDLIFSVLIDTPPSSLDDRRAGYLEKMLVVLFRRRSQTMAEYMNTSLIVTSRSAPVAKQLPTSYKSFAPQLDAKEQPLSQQSSSIIEKFPSPKAPPILMCALLDHLHSHSIMHILQRLLVPSPLRQQGSSKDNVANSKNDGKDDVAASTSIDSDDDEDPTSALNNDFMNAINQMNGNQQISLHDMDDEDVDDEDDLENDLTHLFQCDWSERPDCVLRLLLDRLEGGTDSFLLEYGFPVGYSNDGSPKDCDMEEDDEHDAAFSCSQHAAEILITIIQNSSLDSPVMMSLSTDPALKRVLDIASLSRSASFSNEPKEEGPEFVPYESIMTCAITVLESLLLQLGGYGAVGVDGSAVDQAVESSQTNLSEIGPHTPPPLASLPMHPTSPEAIKADTSTLVSHLPVLLNELSSLLTHPVTKTWLAPAQYTGGQPRLLLGTSRLRILRLVEALVLLGDASVDFDLQHSNILKHCLDLFWGFEWCSMLQQSVANLLVHVFEGGDERSGLQEYFLVKCKLMEKLMDSFGSEEVVDAVESDSVGKGKQDDGSDDGNRSKKGTHDDIDAVVPVSEEDVDSAMEQENGCMDDDESSQPQDSEPIQGTASVASRGKASRHIRKGYMGHIIIICQALAHASANTDDASNELVGDESNAAETQSEPSASLNVEGDLRQPFSTTSPLPKLHSSPNQQETPVGKSSKPSQINLILRRDPLLYDKWQRFAASTLAFEMSVQSAPLGGQPINNGQGETATSDSHNQLTAVLNDTSDDFLGEPPGHMIFGGSGAAVGDIDMDENDLDIAASMMEHLSLPSSTSNGESDDTRGHNRRRVPPTESNLGHNFGSVIPSTTGFKDYIYDDPLGGVHPFDNEDESDRNLDKGSEDDDIMSDAMVQVPRDDKETESTSSDESSVEDDNDDDGYDDVPVMDLFAGNVAFGNDENSGWANFDSFDADPSQKDDNPSKNNLNGEDLLSFSKTPFDFVDTLEEDK